MNKFEWERAILKSDLPATTRHVLLTLGVYMDVKSHNGKSWNCYPPTEQLAKACCLSERAIYINLNIAKKWIKKVRLSKKGTRGYYHEYIPCIPESPDPSAILKSPDSSSKLKLSPDPDTLSPDPDDTKVRNDVQFLLTIPINTNHKTKCADAPKEVFLREEVKTLPASNIVQNQRSAVYKDKEKQAKLLQTMRETARGKVVRH